MIDQEKYCIRINKQFYLSEHKVEDACALIEYLNDEAIIENTLRIPSPYSKEAADEFLNMVIEDNEARGYPIQFAIRDETGKAVGGCGLGQFTYGHKAELGYWLAQDFWGQGIMTSVVEKLCEFAFSEWELVRIWANVYDFNLGSARVLEKNGFKCEGIQKKSILKNGNFIDAKLYALVK